MSTSTSGRKLDPKAAERAAEHVLIHCYDCVLTHRVVRVKYQRQDIFCADVVGKRKDGSTVYAQVTTAKSVDRKKRDLLTVPWSKLDDPVILQAIKINDAPTGYAFYIYKLRGDEWESGDLVHIEKDWLKAYRKN